MKKIFALLLSIWIPIYLIFGLLASCENSTNDEASNLSDTHPSSTRLTKNEIKTSTGNALPTEKDLRKSTAKLNN